MSPPSPRPPRVLCENHAVNDGFKVEATCGDAKVDERICAAIGAAESAGLKVLAHKSAMQQHSREAHRNELKPHQCGQCLKSFSSTHQLAQHVRIHTGEKPYKCSYCERRFKQLSHVQQHTRLHTGERPYKCHLADCGRAFIQLSNLQQHLRNHDGQAERAKSRPFLCNICGKGFASDSSLRTHRSKQHAALVGGAASQSCPICHKICVNAEALTEHMRIAHKEPPPPTGGATPGRDSAASPDPTRLLEEWLAFLCQKQQKQQRWLLC